LRVCLKGRTTDNAPKLHTIFLENVTEDEEPDFELMLPKLRSFSLYFYGPADYGWLVNKLQAATKLQHFDDYKLRVGYLSFCSNV
jgi:hypothetical protein